MPQSHLVAVAVAPGNGDVCVCAGVFVHTCRTCCLLQVVLCSHSWLFIEGLYPLPDSLLRVCLGRWAGSCLWHCTLRHHGSVVIIVLIRGRMFLKSENQTLPADMDGLPWLSIHLVWL